jgi:segregation and condensation protein B
MERTVKLSSAALETLALVAYRQPVTRSEIEAIRGVDSSGVLATLVARELVEPLGRRSTPGNPVEYGTTPAFLQFFGLTSLDELPAVADEPVQADPATPESPPSV